MLGRSTAYGLQGLSNPILVSNTFDDGTLQGWVSYGSLTLAVDNGRLKANVEGAFNGGMKILNVTPGHTYRIRYIIDFGTFIGTVASTGVTYPSWNWVASQSVSGPAGIMQDFTASSTQVALVIETNGATPGGAIRNYYIDNFRLEEVVTPPSTTPPSAAVLASVKKGYRLGFNGKENDDEVYGKGNFEDYGMRAYDTRIMRFQSVDPLTKDYPHYTPYQFAGNTPIQAIDLDGEEEYHYTMTMNKQGTADLKLTKTVIGYNHSYLFGLITRYTEIKVKRYVVDFNLLGEGTKKYYIRFPQYGKGFANAWKADEFESDYVKKKGDPVAFHFNYVDENGSNAASTGHYGINAQNQMMEVAIPMIDIGAAKKRVAARLYGLKDRNSGDFEVRFFGSQVRGNPGLHSDLDVLILTKNKSAFATERVSGILENIKQDFKKQNGGMELDINVMDYGQYQKTKGGNFKKSVQESSESVKPPKR